MLLYFYHIHSFIVTLNIILVFYIFKYEAKTGDKQLYHYYFNNVIVNIAEMI